MDELRFAGAVVAAVAAADATAIATKAVEPKAVFQYEYSPDVRTAPRNVGNADLSKFDVLPGDRVVFQVKPNSLSLQGRKATADLLFKRKKGKKESPVTEGFYRATTAEWATHFYPTAVIPHTTPEKGKLNLDRLDGEFVIESIGTLQLGPLWHDPGSLIFVKEPRTPEEDAAYNQRAAEIPRTPGFAGWRRNPDVNTIVVEPGEDVAGLRVLVSISVYRGTLP